MVVKKSIIKTIVRATVLVLFGLIFLSSATGLTKKDFKVIVVMDTVGAWAVGIRDGFVETLNKQLIAAGAKAEYQFFDTKLDVKTIPEIQAAIDKTKPDLICTINYPTVFADKQITLKPGNAAYKFVSENCIPIQSGLIKDLRKPGGNVTGVGVFIQMNSMIRLAKMINPRVKKLAVYSWDAMKEVNEWFEAEFSRACKEEGIEFSEFRRVSNLEDAIAFAREYEKKGDDYFLAEGIGVGVRRDGTRPDASAIYAAYAASGLKRVMYLSYDEAPIKSSGYKLAGTAVIWYDIGAQLAEKGFKVLGGTKPGDIPWDYPRKFNIVLNKAVAERLGYAFPANLLSAAYRVYTDLEGNFIGQDN